ncbi:MAG: hypothetical protein ACTSYM_03955 [Candidatus Baldrarchaeia archaeon]
MGESEYELDDGGLEKFLAICNSRGSSRKVKVVRKVLRLTNSLISVLPDDYV